MLYIFILLNIIDNISNALIHINIRIPTAR